MDNGEEMQLIIEKYLDYLSDKIISLGEEVTILEKDNSNYINIKNNLLEALKKSKIDFAIIFSSLSDLKKEEHLTYIKEIFNDSDEFKKTIDEINNLACLDKIGLIDSLEVEPQREQALLVLNNLEEKAYKYIENINYQDNLSKIENIKNNISDLLSIAESFNIIQDEVISNCSLFTDTVVMSNLDIEDKNKLLSYVLLNNINFYNKELNKNKKKNIKKEVKKKITISKEVIDELDKLLNNSENIRKIVKIINGKVLGKVDFQREEDIEILDEDDYYAIDLVKEELVSNLEKDKELTPYMALKNFYRNNDQKISNALDLVALIFTDEENNSDYKDKIDIIKKGYDFCLSHQKLLYSLNIYEKSNIDNFMKSLYKDKNSRTLIYRGKYRNSPSEIIREATYEISVIINILKDLDEEDMVTLDIINKASKRINEVFNSLDEVLIKDKKEDTDTSNLSGNIFFLMKNNEKSFIEDDINFDSQDKGINKKYYDDIINLIKQLEDRDNKTFNSLAVSGEKFRNLKKFHTRFISSNRIRLFYIPVGGKDSIITGVSFLKDKEDSQREQDNRYFLNDLKIEELIKALTDSKLYKDKLDNSNIIKNKIFNLKKVDNIDLILDEMINSDNNDNNIKTL
jgi:hypothetical protein